MFMFRKSFLDAIPMSSPVYAVDRKGLPTTWRERACDLPPKSWISSPRKHFCKTNQVVKVQVNRISKKQRMRTRIRNEGTKSSNSTATFLDIACSIREGDLPVVES